MSLADTASPAGRPVRKGHPLAAIVLMGVSGAGKSTIGAALAERIGCPYRDADSFHPAANVAKMSAGTPLTDADRWPWLDAIAAWIEERRRAGSPGVVSCSALRRAYRDRLIGAHHDVRLVYLRGSKALIGARLAERRGHFMPTSLLDSQFAALEEPGSDEAPVTVDIAREPEGVVDAIVAGLGFARP